MALPLPPTREAFPNQEDFEEAMGFWQSRVGRIHGMVAHAKQTEASADSPTKSAMPSTEAFVLRTKEERMAMSHQEWSQHMAQAMAESLKQVSQGQAEDQ